MCRLHSPLFGAVIVLFLTIVAALASSGAPEPSSSKSPDPKTDVAPVFFHGEEVFDVVAISEIAAPERAEAIVAALAGILYRWLGKEE